MANSYIFAGVVYTASDRGALVDFLVAHPDVIDTYTESALETLRGMFGWGAYGQAKDGYAVLCDVLADVAERQGRQVMR